MRKRKPQSSSSARLAVATLTAVSLVLCCVIFRASAETLQARCAQPHPGCRILICHEELIREVRGAYRNGDLIMLLRHTEKVDGHDDDESTPLTPRGVEQAEAIHAGLIRAGLIPSGVRVSSYRRTRDTAARAIPRRDGQTWEEPPVLRKDQCFLEMPKSLYLDSRTAGNTAYVTHSSCIFSTLYVNKIRFDPTPEEHYGVMIFLDRKNLQKPVGCMWPSDWKYWPAE